MADYHIRLYKDSDYETVRDIFVHGITEPYPASFRHTFSLPRVWILNFAVFLLALTTTGSALASFLAVTVAILALLLMNRGVFFWYSRKCLATDMSDINKTYVQRDGCGFWVVESAGEIVGIVGAAPFSHASGQNQVELKRLSVKREHRGKGIGKALCKTVINFAEKSGYEAVVLETSIFRKDSIRLYKRMGFRITGTYHQNYYFLKFIDYLDILFQYDLSKHH